MIRPTMVFIIFSFSTLYASDYRSYFHSGNGLEFGEPSSSFCGLFYENSPNDSLTIANQLFLSAMVLNERGEVIEPIMFVPGRRYKVIALDSVFISIYNPMYQCSFITPYFMLNDLKSGIQFYLNEFAQNEFDSLISRQIFNGPVDYILLGRLYVVLANIDRTFYFVNRSIDFEEALRQDAILYYGNDIWDLYSIFEGKVRMAVVDTSGPYSSAIFDIYDQNMNLVKAEILFEGTTIANVLYETIVPGKDVRKKIYRQLSKNSNKRRR